MSSEIEMVNEESSSKSSPKKRLVSLMNGRCLATSDGAAEPVYLLINKFLKFKNLNEYKNP